MIKRYVESFGTGFRGGVEAIARKLLFMQSDGGLCLWQNFSGLRAILSGPAGGVIGYAKSCFDDVENRPLLGFDMGGTSTDVSRFAGTYDHVFETETAEVTLQVPQLDINTVAAGGGSILHWKNGLFAIGPDVSNSYSPVSQPSQLSDEPPVCRSASGPSVLPQGRSALRNRC